MRLRRDNRNWRRIRRNIRVEMHKVARSAILCRAGPPGERWGLAGGRGVGSATRRWQAEADGRGPSGGVLAARGVGREASLMHAKTKNNRFRGKSPFQRIFADPLENPGSEGKPMQNGTISRNEARACPHFGCASRRRNSDLMVSDSFCGDRTGSGMLFQ